MYAVIEARRAAGRASAPTSSRCCSTPRPRTASASPTRSCATSCSRSCSPGHETTANSLAWAFERLLRHPAAYDRLRDVARSDDDPDGYLEATIHEAMRSRPVIPIIGRRVTVPLAARRVPVPPAARS